MHRLFFKVGTTVQPTSEVTSAIPSTIDPIEPSTMESTVLTVNRELSTTNNQQSTASTMNNEQSTTSTINNEQSTASTMNNQQSTVCIYLIGYYLYY